MLRTTLAVLVALGIATPQTAPKAPSADLTFEVATLKIAAAGAQGGGIRPAPGGERYIATNMPLRGLLMVAYQVKAGQVTGGPSWLDTDTWDMNAKAEKPSTADELHVMLRNLLTERFHLQFHREQKEMPIYALTVDAGGPKMTPHDGRSAGDPWIDQAIDKVVHAKLTATFVPMSYFAWRLGQLLDRPVVDQTGLRGGYDFILSYTRDLPPGLREGALLNGEPIDTSGPTIFEAVRRQLGLRLEARKGPVDVLVLDRIEKPAGN